MNKPIAVLLGGAMLLAGGVRAQEVSGYYIR